MDQEFYLKNQNCTFSPQINKSFVGMKKNRSNVDAKSSHDVYDRLFSHAKKKFLE